MVHYLPETSEENKQINIGREIIDLIEAGEEEKAIERLKDYDFWYIPPEIRLLKERIKGK